MAKRGVSNPLALAVLAHLWERPMHPYELASTMRERGKEESIKLNYGSLYTVVEALERENFIVPQETVREGRRPQRTVYALTEAGRERLSSWMRALLSRPVKEYPQFTAGLSLAGVLPPAEVAALLSERAHHLEQEIRTRTFDMEAHMEGGLPRLFLIEEEHRLVLAKAELAWVRKLAREISEGTIDGIERWQSLHNES
ncbi:MAG TPA: PadR family transcriptional regulator [Actinomycetes bacterium]|jgi:DNA-binding PadR family transcriptional regulator|nr:PadR family transcriptional regulator [Actinomycetes bacterium]